MEGSSVRGQQKFPIAQLNGSEDLQTFQADLVRLAVVEFKYAEVFFGLVDPQSNLLQLPAWIKTHIERHPGLQKKLHQGELVGISASEDSPALRPAATTRSSVVVIPVISQGVLSGAIGLASPLDGPQLSAEDIEMARQLAYEAAPILSRLQEIEKLRRENRELAAKAERADRAEEILAAVVDEKQGLNAILQMHSHQQVNIAHELRTPLAAIRGYSRMILDGRGGEINDTQRQYLRIVTDNTNRMIALVAWMSYVAELSAQHLTLSTFDFREVWTESAKHAQQKMTAKSLKLIQHLSDEPFTIIGDRQKLADAMSDIVTVAIRLAGVGGAITAELSHGREKEVVFKLSEAGAEIPQDVLSKIFDRPFNAITKPTAQNSDSGAISLSSVYDVVGMHGGRVFVNSTAGQGATFLFTLPAVTAGEENSHEQAVNSGRRRR